LSVAWLAGNMVGLLAWLYGRLVAWMPGWWRLSPSLRSCSGAVAVAAVAVVAVGVPARWAIVCGAV